MFVCTPCHKADPTCPAGTKDFESWFGFKSEGRCEVCGKTAVCVDCHGYGSIEDPAKMARLDALNDPDHQVPPPAPGPGRHRADPTPREEGTDMATITETKHEHEFDETTLVCECGVTLAEHVRGIA